VWKSVGGAIFIAAILGIMKIMGFLAAKKSILKQIEVAPAISGATSYMLEMGR